LPAALLRCGDLPEIDIATSNRSAVIVTRLNETGTWSPAGRYAVELHPAAG
jgi:hypothetical protein